MLSETSSRPDSLSSLSLSQVSGDLDSAYRRRSSTGDVARFRDSHSREKHENTIDTMVERTTTTRGNAHNMNANNSVNSDRGMLASESEEEEESGGDSENPTEEVPQTSRSEGTDPSVIVNVAFDL